jgi:hypothetical protein
MKVQGSESWLDLFRDISGGASRIARMTNTPSTNVESSAFLTL